MKNEQKKLKEENNGWIICKEYTNRWGQLMVAADYGRPFWRFPSKRSRKG